ncbi:hypothetical protein GGS24DRAFT_495484 [Hypoxylon argillaceum]|nr:hypothetical protein GGS24DRAFT_495484 [Hypoxylon argillaceum]KAI1144699.1 hypothetical protein F4825DRAFT_467894 [Nemania diffusa]
MRRFDDRFARQNRCEPPPEFPLASPYPRIVHHLSGPNSYALTQIHPKTSGSVDDAPGLTPKHSHKCSTPCILAKSAVLGPRKGIMRRAITLPKELRSLGFYPPAETDAGLDLAKCTGEEHRMIR